MMGLELLVFKFWWVVVILGFGVFLINIFSNGWILKFCFVVFSIIGIIKFVFNFCLKFVLIFVWGGFIFFNNFFNRRLLKFVNVFNIFWWVWCLVLVNFVGNVMGLVVLLVWY